MKLLSVPVAISGHPVDVSRATNFWLDRLAGDQGLHLFRSPCELGSGRYTDRWCNMKTAAQAGHQRRFERVTRGFKKVETGWRPAA